MLFNQANGILRGMTRIVTAVMSASERTLLLPNCMSKPLRAPPFGAHHQASPVFTVRARSAFGPRAQHTAGILLATPPQARATAFAVKLSRPLPVIMPTRGSFLSLPLAVVAAPTALF